MREHLRACVRCRSTLRSYRATPAAAAALAPALPVGRSVFDRAQEMLAGLAARFGGGAGSDPTLAQVAGAGTRGAGAAALAKAAALCVGAVGGAACVASGVVPAALLERDPAPPAVHRPDRVARIAEPPLPPQPEPEVEVEPEAPSQAPATAEPAPQAEPPDPSPQPEAEAGAVEYLPPEPTLPAESPGRSANGDPAGEFGP